MRRFFGREAQMEKLESLWRKNSRVEQHRGIGAAHRTCRQECRIRCPVFQEWT